MSEIKATPAARRAANEEKIDLKNVIPKGLTGYIQYSDILEYKTRTKKITHLAANYAAFYNVDIYEMINKKGIIRKDDIIKYLDEKDDKIPLSGMRRAIASRMSESMQKAPQYSMFMETDASDLKKLLKEYTEDCLNTIKIKPTFTDLLIKAVAISLQRHSILNSVFSDSNIINKKDINIGLAVALEDGLIVPNIKNADRLDLKEITKERSLLVEKARNGSLSPDDYTGGSITISNLGNSPVQYFTPIINPPESAIIGIGSVIEKVVPVEGGIGIKPILPVSLTFDHRIIDGAVGSRYMATLKDIIESPYDFLGFAEGERNG